MSREYLHDHRNFADLIRIIDRERTIDPSLVERDYYIACSGCSSWNYATAYDRTSALYYGAKPSFDEILREFRRWTRRL